MRRTPSLVAGTATIIFVGTLGLLLVIFLFGIIRVTEDMGEGLGLVPTRWGETHLFALIEIAALISAPIVLWASVWFFRKARAAEVRLLAQEEAHG